MDAERKEALTAEFGVAPEVELLCISCEAVPADVRLDNGDPYCTPCCHEMLIMRGLETFRARAIGTVTLIPQAMIEIEVSCAD